MIATVEPIGAVALVTCVAQVAKYTEEYLAYDGSPAKTDLSFQSETRESGERHAKL